jgi:hypothetical protein
MCHLPIKRDKLLLTQAHLGSTKPSAHQMAFSRYVCLPTGAAAHLQLQHGRQHTAPAAQHAAGLLSLGYHLQVLTHVCAPRLDGQALQQAK